MRELQSSAASRAPSARSVSSNNAFGRLPSPPVSPPPRHPATPMRHRLTPQSAMRAMMYKHPVLFAEPKGAQEQAETKEWASSRFCSNGSTTRAQNTSVDAVDKDTAASPRRQEDAFVWQAAHLVASTCAKPDAMLAGLNAYEFSPRQHYMPETTLELAVAARQETVSTRDSTTVQGPNGLLFSHHKRLAGRPLETTDKAGNSMSYDHKRIVMQALLVAKEAANGITAAADEFELRPRNVVDRLPMLAEEEEAVARRLELRNKLLEQVRINETIYEEVTRERDHALTVVEQLSKDELNELKQYRKPPQAVHRTLIAVVSLVTNKLADTDCEYKKVVASLQQVVGEEILTADLLANSLRRYDAATGSELVLADVNSTFCENHNWSYESVARAAPCVAPLCLWVHAQIAVWKATRRIREVDMEAEIAKLPIARSTTVSIGLERTHIRKQLDAVESAVALLSTALTKINDLGAEANPYRRKLLLWRSQLLGMMGKEQSAGMDNELLLQASVPKVSTLSFDSRVVSRRLANSTRLAKTTHGTDALHHAHDVASSLLEKMSKKKITPTDADDTEKAYDTVMKVYARERSFRPPTVNHRQAVNYPACPWRAAQQEAAVQAVQRKQRLTRRRRRQAVRRAEIVRMFTRTQRQEDEAALARRQIRILLEKQWSKDTWTPSDFSEIQQPFDNVRSRLLKAFELVTHNQKLTTDDVPVVHSSLKFVKVPTDKADVLVAGLSRGELKPDLVDLLKRCVPPPAMVDLDALLQVLHEAKPVLIETFASILTTNSRLLNLVQFGGVVDSEDLLIQLSQFYQCVDDAGALDASTDAVLLDRIFSRSLTSQVMKESAGDLPARDIAINETSSSRRMRSTARGELSLLGFVIAIVRVAAGRTLEMASLHQRVETFIQTNLVDLLAKRNADEDDDIALAARQPVVVEAIKKCEECVRACFIQYNVADDVREAMDEDGNVNIDELAIGLKDCLFMFEQLGWYDEWCSRAKTTALYFKVARPEQAKSPGQMLAWEKMTIDEAEDFAHSEELELFFDQFQQLVVRVSFLKEQQVKESTRPATTPVNFEAWVAKIVESCVERFILPKYAAGVFDRATTGDQKAVEQKTSSSDLRSKSGLNVQNHSDSVSTAHGGLDAAERKKLAKGFSALTNASDAASESTDRAELARLEQEAQELAAKAEAKSQLDDEEVKKLFEEIDVDDSGSLEKAEVTALLKRLDLQANDEAVNEIMVEMDPDNDGEVTLTEFMNWWRSAKSRLRSQLTSLADATAARRESERRQRMRSKRGGQLSVSEVELLFNQMDVDGGGTLDNNEIRALMHQLGVPLSNRELCTVMSEMDPNGDGQVDMAEFVRWWSAAGVELKKQMARLADEALEQKEKRRRAQARVDAAKEYRQAARKKMREVERQLQRANFHSWRRSVHAIKRHRGGIGIRVWNTMTKQQRALHNAGKIASGQGQNLLTASGRLNPRRQQPQQTRQCVQCGAEFVLLAHDAPMSGVGSRLATRQAVDELMEQTKELLEVEPKLQAAIAADAAPPEQNDLNVEQQEIIRAKARANRLKLQAVYDAETTKLAQSVVERKEQRKRCGEHRLIPNRDLCDDHRPRLCKYSEPRFGTSATCGRIFTLADDVCRAGGRCCEDTVQV